VGRAGFDDSQWETVDLTPKDGAIDPITGISGLCARLDGQGTPRLLGLRLVPHPGAGATRGRASEELALAGPADVDDGYQVFDNGELAGHFGDFTGSNPSSTAPAQMFPLAQARSRERGTGQDRPGKTEPDRRDQQAEQTRVLAFRLWMEPNALNKHPMRAACTRRRCWARPARWRPGYQMRWLELIRSLRILCPDKALLFGLLAVVAFTLILFDRSDRVYLWMGALFLLIAVYAALEVIGDWTEVLSIPIQSAYELVSPLICAAWVMVFWVWFGLQRHRGCPGSQPR
jgi:hypothetical protein